MLTPLALLAAALAFGEPGAPAQRLADLRGSMEHWVLMARPDAADPEVRALADQLTSLHNRAVKMGSEDAHGIEVLQADFDAWKNRFAKLCFDRRPDGAPGDYDVYRKQLEAGIGGLSQLRDERSSAARQVGTLKRLVDPQAFRWYVEGSKNSATLTAPGWSAAPARARGPESGLPDGWTGPSSGGADLNTDAPPDPALTKSVAQIGERKWKLGGTVGWCYAGVKTVLRKLGVVSSFDGVKGRDGEGKAVKANELVGAYQFNRWVENHPTLQKRKLSRVPEPAWPLAISDVVVWGRGVCGYNDDWGHIEMIYKLSADKRLAWAVSDHSQEFNVDCFKREAARVNEARAKLPELRSDVALAQHDNEQQAKSKDRRAAQRARRALAQKRAALFKAEQAAESLAVFKIGPEKAQ